MQKRSQKEFPDKVSHIPSPGAIKVPVVPTFSWPAVNGAESYDLEISLSPSFNSFLGKRINTPVPMITWPGKTLASTTTHYWRVRPVSASGTGAWMVGVFTTG